MKIRETEREKVEKCTDTAGEMGKDRKREGDKEGEIMYCVGGSCFSAVCWVKCVVLAKIHPWLSRKIFVSVARSGFVALCGRGLKKHLPSLLCAFSLYWWLHLK